MSPRGPGWKPGDVNEPTEDQLETQAAHEDEKENPSPGRGRPKLPPDKHRKNSINLTFTDEEYAELLLLAAKDKQHLRNWARSVLLTAIKK